MLDRNAILDELWAIALMDDVVTEDEAVLAAIAELVEKDLDA